MAGASSSMDVITLDLDAKSLCIPGWRASSAQHDTSKPSTSPTAQWMINTCIAVVFIILFVLYYGANLRARWQYRHIPGPRPRWLLGNTLPGMPGATRRMFYQWPRVYGSVYRLFLGRVPVVVVTDADLARAIAMKHFVKFHDRPFVLAKLYDGQREEFMRAGTLFARGKDWATIRSTVEPIFMHSKNLTGMLPLIHTAVNDLVNAVHHSADQGEVMLDMSKALQNTTMQIIGTSALGVPLGGFASTQKQQAAQATSMALPAAAADMTSEVVHQAAVAFAPPTLHPILLSLMLTVPHLSFLWYRIAWLVQRPKLTALVAATHYLWALVQCVVNSTRDATNTHSTPCTTAHTGPTPATQNTPTTRSDSPSIPTCAFAQPVVTATWQHVQQQYTTIPPPPPTSIIAKMLTARHKKIGRALTDMEICANAFTFLLGGYETTSTSVALALHLLAGHPEIQEQVAKEALLFVEGGLEGGSSGEGLGGAGGVLQQQHGDGEHMGVKGTSGSGQQQQNNAVHNDNTMHNNNTTHNGHATQKPSVSSLSLEQLQTGFPWATAVVKETLRLYPVGTPLVALSRACSQPIALPGGVYIPAGTRMMLNVNGMHRRSDYFDNPDRFLPGAAQGVQAEKLHRWAPFGLGPRKCIGYKLAMLEAVLCLVSLCGNFTFRLPTPHQAPPPLKMGVTLVPKQGVKLVVAPRRTLR